MISKERLEELIEQGAIIYTDEYRNSHFKIKLRKHFVAKLGNSVDLYGYGCDYFGIPLNHLFETKEEAEWHKEFGCIERTERLELPTWEDFDKKGYIKFVGKEATKLILEKTLTIDYDREPISYYVLVILIDDYNHNLLFQAEYTKENYTLACRKCKELFLGDKE